MRATNIRFLLQLKKQGVKIHFAECPACHCFFGTTDTETITCSGKCDTDLGSLADHRIEILRNFRFAQPKPERVF